MHRTRLPFLALASTIGWLAPPAVSQWAALPSGRAMTTEAFHVIAEQSGTAHAYSAMAAGWLELGPPHSDPTVSAPALRAGDWTALLRTGPGTYRAYSARLHDYAEISFTNHPDQIQICVEDDVILVIGSRAPGQPQVACAYSAQFNRWQTLSLGELGARDVACSRFVAGVIRTDNNRAYGFSARRGLWRSIAGNSSCSLRADGNVLLADFPAPAPVSAFSGVLGSWSASPAQLSETEAAIDHNVGLVRADNGSIYPNLCGYSAYEGVWVSGRRSRGPATLSDNIVHVTGTINPNRHYAFGARPGAWNDLFLSSGSTSSIEIGDDLLVVHDRTAGEAHGLSGVCTGGFRVALVPASSTITAFDHLATTMVGSATRVFCAAAAAWTPAIVHGSGARVDTSAVSFFYGSSVSRALGTRFGTWVDHPRNAIDQVQMTGYQFVSEYDKALEQLAIFDESYNIWQSVDLSGAGNVTRYNPHDNCLLVAFDGVGFEMVGVSAQRGDAVPASGFAAPRSDWGVDENVGWALDANGTLHAFGSPDATHAWFQYPLDSEFQIFHDAAATPVPSKTMLRGIPGESSSVLVGFTRHAPPLVFPGIGDLHCNFVVGIPAGVFGPDGLLDAPLELAFAGSPATFELCAQGMSVAFGGALTLLGSAAEPLRYH